MAGQPELSKGSSGEWVQYLQQMLQHFGYWQGATDGEFGDELEQAVQQLQGAYGLPADGQVGASTWAVLSGETSKSTDSGGSASAEDQVLEIDWASEFPALYAAASAADTEDYLRRVIGIDPETFIEEGEPVA